MEEDKDEDESKEKGVNRERKIGGRKRNVKECYVKETRKKRT